MNEILLLYKPLGLTPLEALQLARQQYPQYAHHRLGAAGRLDPMAEGLLLVMVDEANKQQASYIGLNKTYEVEMLLGMTTDSYDLLGRPQRVVHSLQGVDSTQLNQVLARLVGEISQPYPPYSAVRVNSKPLYWWARNNRLNEIEIPSATRNILSISQSSLRLVDSAFLSNFILSRISLVKGDFRQENIVNEWQELLTSHIDLPIQAVTFTVACSSGTYVRSLVHEIGRILGTGATTSQIIRTHIGEYSIEQALRLTS